jgi:hypothetical protein
MLYQLSHSRVRTQVYEVRARKRTSISSMMPKNTTARGELSEWEVALALARTGKNVLRPLSAGLRYDLALDNGDGSITRIQCKTGILRN